MVILVQNFNVSDSSIEADYAWVYFSLSAPLFNDHEIYINGMFNNYSLTPNSKWITIQRALRNYFDLQILNM
jgi:hypothetical protein